MSDKHATRPLASLGCDTQASPQPMVIMNSDSAPKGTKRRISLTSASLELPCAGGGQAEGLADAPHLDLDGGGSGLVGAAEGPQLPE